MHPTYPLNQSLYRTHRLQLDAWDRAISSDPRRIMGADVQFVVTPWRNSKELLELRHDLYGTDTSKKTRAVNKVS